MYIHTHIYIYINIMPLPGWGGAGSWKTQRIRTLHTAKAGYYKYKKHACPGSYKGGLRGLREGWEGGVGGWEGWSWGGGGVEGWGCFLMNINILG